MNSKTLRVTAGAAILSLALLTGCKSKYDKALDQAKAQAVTSSTPQQVQYVNGSGDTVTSVVTPPMGSSTQQVTTTKVSPPTGTHPAETDPVVTPYNANNGSLTSTQVAPDGTPLANPAPVTPAPGSTVTTSTSTVPEATPQQAAAAPAVVDVRIPAGTEIAMRLDRTINVKSAQVGDRFSGEIVEALSQNGNVVVPRGTAVSGRIDAAHRRGHFKGRSILELRLTAMTLNGKSYDIDTHDHVNSKKGKGRRSAGFIGGLTGAGMLIGGIATGGVGLAIGAAAGAGTGTLLAGTTGNRDIVLPAESILHFRLAEPVFVQQ
jgi:hypothetical protein